MNTPEPSQAAPATAGAAEPATAPSLTDVILDQTFDIDSLYPLRSAVAAHTSITDPPQHFVDAAVIVVAELASNAIRYGGGAGRMLLGRTSTGVTIQVSDNGPGLTDPLTAGTVPAPPGAVGGRGLWIVRQLSATVDITTGPHGTTVTATLVQPAL